MAEATLSAIVLPDGVTITFGVPAVILNAPVNPFNEVTPPLGGAGLLVHPDHVTVTEPPPDIVKEVISILT